MLRTIMQARRGGTNGSHVRILTGSVCQLAAKAVSIHRDGMLRSTTPLQTFIPQAAYWAFRTCNLQRRTGSGLACASAGLIDE